MILVGMRKAIKLHLSKHCSKGNLLPLLDEIKAIAPSLGTKAFKT